MEGRLPHRCPNCESPIPCELEAANEFCCPACQRRFKVMREPQTGRVGLIDLDERQEAEPLLLPRGSIRSLVTLVMAISCWFLVVRGREVPDCLFSLLLTIVGYYFGFRKKTAAVESTIYDPALREKTPLFLPRGYIRFFLMGGFILSGVFLYAQGRFQELKYFEVYIVLAGFMLGYAMARLLSRFRGRTLFILIDHLKGILVLLGAGYLTYEFMGERFAGNLRGILLLCCWVSFYFGSRS